jgi:metallo-beta-lactamase class B
LIGDVLPFVNTLALAACAGAATTAGYTAQQCPHCAEWNAPQAPRRVFGNTYWVGTAGLGSVLIVGPQGDVLIDGALPESAPRIEANIRALGFRVQDVKLILNSHAHFDHAGGIAQLQRDSGAQVAASAPSAQEISTGHATPDDPQAAIALAYPAAHDVRVIADGETVHVGPLALTAHFTPGHTPGGTTWTWQSCEGDTCHSIVYADSLTAVSADGVKLAPVASQFEHSFDVIERLPCEILMTPHPSASGLWDRPLVDPDACKRMVADAREGLAKRLTTERGTP